MQTAEWNNELGEMVVRDLTAGELAEVEVRVAEAIANAQRQEIADTETYLDEVRDLRERILNRLAGIGAAALALGDQVAIDAFVLARQRLLDITKIPGALAATTRREMEIAIKTEYVAIVQSVPPSLIAAFDQVDQ